jgi:hypothetical protein
MIKIITGYRSDEYKIIQDEEAHIAYYLFANPDKRAILSGGVTLRGSDIHDIQPAYNETMGWNPTHRLTDDDWNEIRSKGIEKKLIQKLTLAKTVAVRMSPKDISTPLPEVAKTLGLLSAKN